MVAEFDGAGLLQAVTTLNDRVKTKTSLEFMEYGTTRKSDKSGAYLFLPGMILSIIMISKFYYIAYMDRWTW